MPKPSDDRPFYVFAMRASASMVQLVAVPAIVGAVVGAWLDRRFGIGPYGTAGALGLAIVLSAFAVWRKAKALGEEYQRLVNDRTPPKPKL